MKDEGPECTAAGEYPADEFISHGRDVEMRWDSVDGWQHTPNDRFFVRNHTSTPRIDLAAYRLRMFGDGLAGAPTIEDAHTFTLDEIRDMGSVTHTYALECTGNGRRFFATQQDTHRAGTQWGLGAIGVAKWGGVSLTDLLSRVGVLDDAVDVMGEGLDEPYLHDGVDHGRVRRPVPIGKALDDVLVAYEMNGEPLPPDHGYPLRLVVPGWVGIASIKWLGSIHVSKQPLSSPWTTVFYRIEDEEGSTVLTEMPVKSAFELAWETSLEVGVPGVLRGRSWSGTGAIERVEVSTDGGENWTVPELFGPNEPKTWVRWELPWTPTEPGRYELLARASDTEGRTQPDSVAPNDDGYLFWAVVRHPVDVV
ncbi:MAG: molybdopterin-dependent oxidoreductase [Acidimicrobiia bacterium]|nr:molybdopterin-dependent oxidoreductase [Acidimicrobiia bacterium]